MLMRIFVCINDINSVYVFQNNFFPATNCKNFAVLLSPTTALAINMTWVIFITIMALYQQLLEIGKGIDHI